MVTMLGLWLVLGMISVAADNKNEMVLNSESDIEVESEYDGIFNIEEKKVTILKPGKYKVYGQENITSNQIIIKAEGKVEITIENVKIVGPRPFQIKKGTVKLYLKGKNLLEAKYKWGVEKNAGIWAGKNKLTIEGNGYLKAKGNDEPGISGKYLTINSGTIEAYGGDLSAGIGGGRYAAVGTIRITGGKIKAIGSEFGAGIGTGMNGTCEKIQITGGTIHAEAGCCSAAIGLGGMDCVTDDVHVDSYLNKLSISGGKIHVKAYTSGSVGIGVSSESSGRLKNFHISGGTISCKAGKFSEDMFLDDIACEGAEKIVITGGSIQAEQIKHTVVNDKNKTLYRKTIFVGKKYKNCKVTKINNVKYKLKDVVVNEQGFVTVYLPKDKIAEIYIKGKLFTDSIVKGKIYTIGKYKYKVTGYGEVTCMVNNKIDANTKIPNTVKINDEVFKVVRIEK